MNGPCSDGREEDFRQLGSGTVLQRERALTRIEKILTGRTETMKHLEVSPDDSFMEDRMCEFF